MLKENSSSKVSSQAFTLIELLVVIAIITILTAILFPVFSSAREKARQATCASNLKQIGIAMLQYEQDNDEFTSGAARYNATIDLDPLWPELIYPYVKSVGVFSCPSEQSKNEYYVYTCGVTSIENGNPDFDHPGIGIAYAINTIDEDPYTADSCTGASPATTQKASNCIGVPPNSDSTDGIPLSKLTEPSNTIQVADAVQTTDPLCFVRTSEVNAMVNLKPNGTTEYVENFSPVQGGATWYYSTTYPTVYNPAIFTADVHTSGRNYTYYDGHVKWLTTSNAEDWYINHL